MNDLKKAWVLPLFIWMFFACGLEQNQGVPIIFDTDMGPDYDDVGAMALLHAFADKGEIEILATVASTRYEGVAAVIDVLNTYFKRPDLPIGVAASNGLDIKDFQHWTDTLQARYPHSIRSNSEVADAVKVYRQVLSQQADSSTVIVTVGFLTNIAALLASGPDQYSPLGGKDLIAQKVKRLVSMAGRFPEGREFNITEDAKSAKFAFENFPAPVIFSGFEIGEAIKTGLPVVNNAAINNSPVKDAYRIGIASSEADKQGRMSWDQTAVLVAVRGHLPWFQLKKGRIAIDEAGNNSWSEGSGQFYLVADQSMTKVQRLIDELMQHQP